MLNIRNFAMNFIEKHLHYTIYQMLDGSSCCCWRQ